MMALMAAQADWAWSAQEMRAAYDDSVILRHDGIPGVPAHARAAGPIRRALLFQKEWKQGTSSRSLASWSSHLTSLTVRAREHSSHAGEAVHRAKAVLHRAYENPTTMPPEAFARSQASAGDPTRLQHFFRKLLSGAQRCSPS